MVDKFEYLAEALSRDLHHNPDWFIQLVSTSIVDEEAEKYPYMLGQDLAGHYYLDENLAKVMLTNSNATPLFKIHDRILADSKHCKLLSAPTETTLGLLLTNKILIEYGLNGNLPYINKKHSISDIEKAIALKLTSNPADGVYKEGVLYVRDLIRFINGIRYLESLTKVFLPGTSDITITEPTGIAEFKRELMNSKKYKGNLTNPRILQEFEEELIAFDRKYIEQDESGKYFMGDAKSRTVVRKALYLSQGYEEGFKPSRGKVEPVLNSLTEGNSVDSFVAVSNISRSNTANRAIATAKGGYLAKTLSRATSSVKVVSDDCGTKLGVVLLASNTNRNKITNRYLVMSKGDDILITNEIYDTLLGKKIVVRSPMFCKAENGYCRKCLGKKITDNEEAINLQGMQLGNAIQSVTMAAAHTAAKVLVDIDINDLVQ
jgi:hypothetical protein